MPGIPAARLLLAVVLLVGLLLPCYQVAFSPADAPHPHSLTQFVHVAHGHPGHHQHANAGDKTTAADAATMWGPDRDGVDAVQLALTVADVPGLFPFPAILFAGKWQPAASIEPSTPPIPPPEIPPRLLP